MKTRIYQLELTGLKYSQGKEEVRGGENKYKDCYSDFYN